MPNIPQDLRYHPEHTWARLEDGRVRVGVTDYAQEQLDTVVYVDVPEVDTPCSRDRRSARSSRPRRSTTSSHR